MTALTRAPACMHPTVQTVVEKKLQREKGLSRHDLGEAGRYCHCRCRYCHCHRRCIKP